MLKQGHLAPGSLPQGAGLGHAEEEVGTEPDLLSAAGDALQAQQCPLVVTVGMPPCFPEARLRWSGGRGC